MNLEEIEKIAKRYQILKKLDYNNELLSYFLFYKKENRTHFCLVRQHDFLTMFGDTDDKLERVMGDREKTKELLSPAMKHYRKVLNHEIKTIENRILERDWGVKV